MGVVKGGEKGICESFGEGRVGGKGGEGREEMREQVKGILESDNKEEKKRTNGRWWDKECEKGKRRIRRK